MLRKEIETAKNVFVEEKRDHMVFEITTNVSNKNAEDYGRPNTLKYAVPKTLADAIAEEGSEEEVMKYYWRDKRTTARNTAAQGKRKHLVKISQEDLQAKEETDRRQKKVISLFTTLNSTKDKKVKEKTLKELADLGIRV